MVDNVSHDCPITKLKDTFCSSLKGLSNHVFRSVIAFGVHVCSTIFQSLDELTVDAGAQIFCSRIMIYSLNDSSIDKLKLFKTLSGWVHEHEAIVDVHE